MLNLILDICALRLLNMCVHRDMKNFNKKYQGLGDMPSSGSGISRSGVDRFGTLTAFPCLVCSIAYVRNCKNTGGRWGRRRLAGGGRQVYGIEQLGCI